MEITNKTIVLMIDFDNFNSDEHLNILFDELKQMRNVIYKGAFYSNTDDKNIYKKGKKYGFNDFIVETTYSSRKNAVDIRIALDVIKWLRKDYVDCFCLATNDLDFAPIVRRIKQKNKTVINAGNLEKSQEYKKLYHRFISVDKILNAKKLMRKNLKKIKKKVVLKIM
ncbi:NYN domain-containing protein [Spiroplasma endosymbiont of Seladonia tumulorum]|uniref:NYN domain-containing protein n=1 Tax=Spiroplasma endosymbiont of Seladonia tumulorum TaxID=3066321 RepID=UPI0030CEE4CD